LAPALDLSDFSPAADHLLDIPVSIFHGNADDIVPPFIVKEIASRIYPQLDHHLVNDNHPLSRTFETYDWDRLLDA
jgi:hypothetical protein